jgi:hypothetical protein
MAEPHSDEGDEGEDDEGEEGCDDEGSVQVSPRWNHRASYHAVRDVMRATLWLWTFRTLWRFGLYRSKMSASTRSSKPSANARC